VGEGAGVGGWGERGVGVGFVLTPSFPAPASVRKVRTSAAVGKVADGVQEGAAE